VTLVGFGPSWSPDGTNLLTAVVVGDQEWREGTVRASDGTFTALPKALRDGVHHRWSADGERIAWTSGECVVWHGRADGTDVRKVPVLGDPSSATNPRKLRACDIVSVNGDASRLTVALAQGNDSNGDIGGTQWANAVIETATGAVLALPVRGTVVQALYRTDGKLLVVTEAGGRTTLSLLDANLRVVATMPQPRGARGLSLHDHTR
jgi:TolB protein